MNADPSGSRRKLIERGELAYALCGGPLAWLAQMNVDYPLLTVPCFSGAERNLSLPANAQWAVVAAVVVYVGILLFALGAGVRSYSLFKRLSEERSGAARHFGQAGVGITRFLAFWGMLLGFGFSTVILLNAIALLMIPPCAL